MSGDVVLKAQDIRLTYGETVVLDEVTLGVRDNEMTALVGPNASGKTSLVRILAGLKHPDSGRVLVFRKGLPAEDLRRGYLPQAAAEDEVTPTATLLETVLSGNPQLLALEAQIGDLARTLAARPADEGLVRNLGVLQERFEAAGGYESQTLARASLRRVGFVESDFSRPLADFSGGQKTRARLAGLLARDPELLLLDEPTNHLDLESLEWLEDFLLGYSRPVLIVSHDRYHLDRVADRVFELKRTHVQEYVGNYSAYVRQSKARTEEHERLWGKEERERLRLKEVADRQMRWAEKAHNAAGINDHRRRLAKKGSRRALATARRLERHIENGVEKPWEDEKVRVSLPDPGKAGGPALILRDVAAGYGGRPVFEGLDLWVKPGERLIVVGPNGAGKSTLLRLLAGDKEPLSGEVLVSPGLRTGYHHQELEDQAPNLRPFDLAAEAGQEGRWAAGLSRSEIRTYLGTFLFRGDDVFRPLGGLSLGERVRLSLACLLLRDPDLLLLDEPTNHLDIPSREAFEEALVGFKGTVVLVSHDRFLLSRVGTRVLDLGCPGYPRVCPGDYSYYLEKREPTSRPGPGLPEC